MSKLKVYSFFLEDINVEDMIKVIMERVENKRWNLNINDTDETEYQMEYKGVLLNSPHNAMFEINKVLERIDFNKHFSLYVFGLRNTLLIREIMRRKSQFSAVTIIEIADEDTIELLANKDFVDIFTDRTVEVIIGNKSEILESVQNNIRNVFRTYNSRNTDFIICPYAKTFVQRDIQDIINYIFENMYYLAGAYGNSVEDVLWGIDNLVNNWEYSTKGLPVDEFKNKFKGKPAIIVGAGPSLDKNVHLLKELKDKALIFGVDTAVDDLHENGVIPDAVSTIERTEGPVELYSQVDAFDDTVFLGPNVIKGEILAKFDKWIFTGRHGDAVVRKLTDEMKQTNLEVGNNVAHVPFAFARHLGCDPIIFVGLDLAFADGVTHSKEVNKYLTEDILGIYLSRTTKVRGQNVPVLETYEEFMYARVWFETEIAKDRNFRYLNATEGGSYIEGCDHVTLQSILEELKNSQTIENRLNDVYHTIPIKEGYDQEITEIAIAFMESLKEDINGLRELAVEVKEDVVGNEKFGRVGRIEEKRVVIDEYLLKNVAMRFIFQSVNMSYNRDLHSFPIVLETKDEEGLVNRTTHYYDTLDLVGKKVCETIDLYLEILNNILNELE